MSRDNWERLVAAVLKKEALWQLFHEQSRSPSLSSGSSSGFSLSSHLNSSLDDIPISFTSPIFSSPIQSIVDEDQSPVKNVSSTRSRRRDLKIEVPNLRVVASRAPDTSVIPISNAHPKANWPDSYPLPLPPVTNSNSSPVSRHNSAATSPSTPLRSPERGENVITPVSPWKKGKFIARDAFGNVHTGFNSETGEMCAMKEVTLFGDDAKSKQSAMQLGKQLETLSETMEKRGINKTISDQAIHLDLIAKRRGIAAAETYFINLPESSKHHSTYGALLNCYCKDLMTEKAVALLEKMKELNLELSSMPYNSLMTLYFKSKLPQMVPPFIQEMKANDIMPDVYTYNIWMRSLAAVGDISGVERVIDEMKRDSRVVGDWTTYSNLALIYADAKLFDKTEKALKELESRNATKELSAYQFLITLYGRTGNLLEVHRVWRGGPRNNFLMWQKKTNFGGALVPLGLMVSLPPMRVWRSQKFAFPKTANISYLNMIQVLVKLNDLPGAEKCFKEWASNCSTYDIRITNVLIGAYLQEGSFEKAETQRRRAWRRGPKPNAKTWELYFDYYLKRGEIKSGVECVEKAIEAGKGDGGKWVPSREIVGELMKRFEENNDVEGAEGFLEIVLKAKDVLGGEVLEALIRIYAGAGRKNSIMRRRVEMENVELSGEGEKLLNDISEE